MPRAEWFVQLSLYQARPSDVDVMIEDAGQDLIAPVGGSHVQVPTTLAQVNRRLLLEVGRVGLWQRRFGQASSRAALFVEQDFYLGTAHAWFPPTRCHRKDIFELF